MCTTLNRSDFQVWVTRLGRLELATAYATLTDRELSNYEVADIEQFRSEINQQLSLYRNEYMRLTGQEYKGEHVIMNIQRYWFRHYAGLAYHKIQNYRFDSHKTMEQTWADLYELEEEYKQQEGKLLTMEDGDEIIKNFSDGFVWMALSRGSCSQEASAMGHCGNSGARQGDQIISLRKLIKSRDGVNYYAPVLTFILNQGKLGEMKGRANDKPAKRYHPYIMELLKMDIITGIVGGGYMPSNNFALSDLTPEQQDEILTLKPQLGSLLDRYNRLGDSPELRTDILNWLVDNADGFGYRSGRPHNHRAMWEGDNLVVDKWAGIADFVEDIALDDVTKKLVSDDAFVYWDFEAGRDGAETVLKDLPLQVRIQIGDYVVNTYGDEIDDPADDKEVISVLEDNDDAIYDTLRSANRDGQQSGAEAEAINALFGAVKDTIRSVKRGRIVSKDVPINWDSELALMMTVPEAVKLVSDLQSAHDDNDELGFVFIFWDEDDPKDVLIVSEPYYGWSGYDENVATDRFIEEVGIEIGDKEPDRPDFYELSDDEKRKIANDLYDKIPDGYIRKVDLDQIEGSRLASTVEGLWRKFYDIKK